MGFLEQYDATPDANKAALLLESVLTTPDSVYAELRATRPILVAPGTPPVAVIARHEDVVEALGRWTALTVRLQGASMDGSVGPFMLGRDDTPLNAREKGLMLAMLPREDMPAVRALASGIAAALLAPVLATGQCEVVGTLGRPVALGVVARYFGFPGPDMATMARWSRATQTDMFYNLAGAPGPRAACVQAGAEMRAYLPGLIAERRAASNLATSTDVLSRLLRTHLPAELGWNEDRLLSNVMGLLVGAVETSNQAITQALDQFLQRPAALAQAAAAAQAGDDATFDALVWEVLRFNPINPFVPRVAVTEVVIGDGGDHATAIPAGALTLVGTRSAMQDGAVVTDPQQIKLHRPPWCYMHFGQGPHECLGKYVGMMLIPATLQHLLTLPALRRAPGAAGQLDRAGGPFPESLTVQFG